MREKSVLDEVQRGIRLAMEVLEGVVHRTPLSRSYTFSKMTGGDVYLKLENLQKTGSFKVRGAYYALWKRVKEGGVREVVAASSGNHAQGVAYAAQQLGVRATIVMPEYTPVAKVEATRSYGADVVLYGPTYDDAYQKAVEIAESRGAAFIHPFNDVDVISGQGTIGVEVFRELEDPDVVVVPIGGGGLISGIAAALKRLRPSARVVGVQPEGAAAMYASLKAGRIVRLPSVSTIADGVAVKQPMELTFELVRELVDDVVLVDDFEIARALFLLLERAKLVAEPAGALSVAAILSGKVDVSGKKVVAVISGGNVDMSLLARIVERGLYISGRHVKIRGVLPDRPGELKKVIDEIAALRINIVAIEHERVNPLVKPGMAEVTLALEVPGEDVVRKLLGKLKERGLEFSVVGDRREQ